MVCHLQAAGDPGSMNVPVGYRITAVTDWVRTKFQSC